MACPPPFTVSDVTSANTQVTCPVRTQSQWRKLWHRIYFANHITWCHHRRAMVIHAVVGLVRNNLNVNKDKTVQLRNTLSSLFRQLFCLLLIPLQTKWTRKKTWSLLLIYKKVPVWLSKLKCKFQKTGMGIFCSLHELH